eukprot:CAMPEP_0174258292 /NCGR_PEP_ID=MMETSP0439-20130205/7307_1 /TAXON_ID=0 /ORGANISM="Stereomyxa ramosa, Strain Chinc5" /LENGTH=696 /DNA_ID=CAMNT_0015341745 /DNA_START=193 /DNA_END=2280 /DNA_ORIENTATION=+
MSGRVDVAFNNLFMCGRLESLPFHAKEYLSALGISQPDELVSLLFQQGVSEGGTNEEKLANIKMQLMELFPPPADTPPDTDSPHSKKNNSTSNHSPTSPPSSGDSTSRGSTSSSYTSHNTTNDSSPLPTPPCSGRRGEGREKRGRRGKEGGDTRYSNSPGSWSRSSHTARANSPYLPHVPLEKEKEKESEREQQIIDGVGVSVQDRKVSDEDIILMITKCNIDLNKHLSNGTTLLALAVQAGRTSLVEAFIAKGADVNRKTKKGNAPLFVALKMKGVHRSAMVKLLLKWGADITERDADGSKVEDYQDNLVIEYWMERAKLAGLYNKRTKKKCEKLGMANVRQIYFSLVGQSLATELILEAIIGKRSDPELSKKPVVLFNVGPPGHGKTQIAEDVAKIIVSVNDYCRENCASIVDPKFHLFGAEVGYRDSGNPPGVGKFMQAHDGEMGVMTFEEFEKLPGSALQSLLHPFESGEWPIKSGGSKTFADCSNIIFFITSNLKSEEIMLWIKEKDAMEKYASARTEGEKYKIRHWIQNEITKIVKREIETRYRCPEFNRRITVVPFISFTKREKRVLTLNYQDELAARYMLPPTEKRHEGNLTLHFTKKYTEGILEKYHPSEGASSLMDPIRQNLHTSLSRAQTLSEDPKHVYFFYSSYGMCITTFDPTEIDEVDEEMENKEQTQQSEAPTASTSENLW